MELSTFTMNLLKNYSGINPNFGRYFSTHKNSDIHVLHNIIMSIIIYKPIIVN